MRPYQGRIQVGMPFELTDDETSVRLTVRSIALHGDAEPSIVLQTKGRWGRLVEYWERDFRQRATPAPRRTR